MAETSQDSPELRQKHAAIALLLRTLVTSAKTASLYKPGHDAIKQICARTKDILAKTLGGESTLTLDIKARAVVCEEAELPDAPETAAFASALHTLGIGQVLFTERLMPEGIYGFFTVLTAKPDGKTSLNDLQKTVMAARIDGLQMTFIQSFVVTGEQEQKEQLPGQLDEEQIEAFIRSQDLPDLLTMLLRQNEELVGKEAEGVTDILYGALERELPIEDFTAKMPWDRYDPRIRARFDGLLAESGREKGRTRRSLISSVSVLRKDEEAAREWRHTHERAEAVRWSLGLAHGLMDRPASEKQPKYAKLAYVRLVAEMSNDGLVVELVGELPRLKALEPALRDRVVESLGSRLFAEKVAASTRHLAKSSPEFTQLLDFLAFIGDGITPLLLGELANVSDKAHRAQLCTLLACFSSRVGTQTLLKALGNEDWFLVSNVVGILLEAGDRAVVPRLTPLLAHSHAKVREAAVKALLKFGGEEAVAALADYLARAEPEETAKPIIALSLLNHPGLDAKLIAACRKTSHYATQVSIVTALGRCATNQSLVFLKTKARRTWYEVVTGRNKELYKAARHSLELLRKEGHV